MSAIDNARNPRFQRSMCLAALAVYPIWVVAAVTVRSSSLRGALLDGKAIGYTLGSLLVVFVAGRLAGRLSRDDEPS
jgi:hypothetical protein